MTFEEYVNGLIEFMNSRPELKDKPVVYSIDSEGNAFHEVYWSATPGHYDGIDDFYTEDNIKEEPEEYDEDIDINAVCIN